MTVGYYPLPSWAYGLEHQNTAPFSATATVTYTTSVQTPPLWRALQHFKFGI